MKVPHVTTSPRSNKSRLDESAERVIKISTAANFMRVCKSCSSRVRSDEINTDTLHLPLLCYVVWRNSPYVKVRVYIFLVLWRFGEIRTNGRYFLFKRIRARRGVCVYFHCALYEALNFLFSRRQHKTFVRERETLKATIRLCIYESFFLYAKT